MNLDNQIRTEDVTYQDVTLHGVDSDTVKNIVNYCYTGSFIVKCDISLDWCPMKLQRFSQIAKLFYIGTTNILIVS